MKNRTEELVLRLKQVREERGLSVQRVYDMLADAGYFVSLSTVKRVFAKDSEKQNFRYQDTLQPIANVLLGLDENGQGEPEVEALKTVVLLKDDMISKQAERINYFENELKRKNRIIALLAVLSVFLALFIAAVVVYDRLNPDIGWFRAMNRTMDSASQVLSAIRR